MYELINKPITHELILNNDDSELSSTTKNMALKAKRKEEPSNVEDDEKHFALITKGLARILKMKNL